MLYWTVETAVQVCMKALDGGSTQAGVSYQYDTCGNLKRGGPRPIYGGNFWWTTAVYVREKQPAVADLSWETGPAFRFKAEEYLLAGSTSFDQEHRHYCVHHCHHDMNNCRTPRPWYALTTAADVYSEDTKDTTSKGGYEGGNMERSAVEEHASRLSFYPMRANGNCFNNDYLPKNRSKDPVSWCHAHGFPWAPDLWDERQRAALK